MQALSEQVSGLEQQYLSLSQSLTPARAQALGYVVPQNVTTVFIPHSSGVLTLAGKSQVQ